MSAVLQAGKRVVPLASVAGYVVAALVLAGGTGYAAGFWQGERLARGQAAIDQVAEFNALIEVQREQLAQLEEVRRANAKRREDLRVQQERLKAQLAAYRERPGPGDRDCLDVDGVRLWNAANAGAALAVGRPGVADADSDAAAGHRHHGQGSAGQPRRDRDAAARVPDAARRAGGGDRNPDAGE